MAMTASVICQAARNRAKATNYTVASGQYLNTLLQTIAQTYDFEVNKHAFNFTLAPATAAIGNLNVQLASGPFTLPPDYLRAKLGDVMYFPTSNWPLLLTPIDLEQFDLFVQQAGFQNFPTYWATDTSIRRDILVTSGASTAGNGTITNLISTTGVKVGMGVYGDMIAPGTATLVTVINSSTSVTVAPAANVLGPFAQGDRSITFAVCPIAYVWPPVSGSYPAFARYYAQTPDIWVPENAATVIPWFQNTDILIDGVAGRLMKDTGDERWIQYLGEDQPNSVPTQLRKILVMKDDATNRSKTVKKDPRRFGPSWSRLPPSKVLGY